MPRFGNKSRRNLAQLDNRLQLILTEAITHIDFSILCGHRGKAEQNRLVSLNKSQTPWPESKHNSTPAKAVDIAPYYPTTTHIDWADREGFIYLAGIIRGIACLHGTPLRWGGDWDNDNDQRDENFRDLAHFEIND